MGYIPNLHLKRQDKGIELARQANSIFIKASAGYGNLFVLPANIGDSFRLSALTLAQLKLQSGIEDWTLLLAALRGAAALYTIPGSD